MPELKFEVSPSVWQKFQRISGDIKRDPNEVETELIEKAYEEFSKPQETPVTETQEKPAE